MEENARVTRRQRLPRLANKRVKAIKAIQLLGNLSSPALTPQFDASVCVVKGQRLALRPGELGNLVLHVSGRCPAAGRGPTMQRVAYLGQ
jgi:hypothetical protein